MSKIIKGIAEVGLSPLVGLAKLAEDISGDSTDEEQALAILTLGASSVIKGTFMGITKGVSDIFE